MKNIFKKPFSLKPTLLLVGMLLVIGMAGVNLMTPSTASAAPAHTFSGDCKKSTFLGMVPWYNYIEGEFTYSSGNPTSSKDHPCSIKCFNVTNQTVANDCGKKNSDIPPVLLAIVDDLLRLAGIVSVAFVLVGAFKFVTSQGNPEDTANAQSTVINALIGVAIAIISIAFVSYIGHQINATTPSGSSATGISGDALPQVSAGENTIKDILRIVFGFIGGIAVLIIVVSGFRYIISAGDPQKMTNARNGIIYALVGLVIAILAQTIVSFVVNRVWP